MDCQEQNSEHHHYNRICLYQVNALLMILVLEYFEYRVKRDCLWSGINAYITERIGSKKYHVGVG